MAEKSANQDELPDVKELAARMAEIGERSNRIVRQFLERQDDEIFQVPDPRVVTDAFTQFAGHLLANPEELVEAQLAYWKDMGQQNELMQLIQYTPTTETVYKRPLLIVPPWINKFYILDLQPQNSFIRFAVEQGFTVFVISWVNPDEELSHKTFESYMLEGPLEALDAIEQATGEKEVTSIGYCLGGTLMSATLSYMAAKKDNRIKALTLFTTLLDFSDPGELGVFIDEEQLALVEKKMMKRGFLDGAEMAGTFNMLRANDLIWSFVVNNYLLGKEPFPFDLLYWNSDSTRMPAAMHNFYLRRFYHENLLVEPGGIELGGVPIDIKRLRLPVYWVSTREDHIAPWVATYQATQILKGPKRFVLAGSGHIAGVINPPASGKYGYWDPQAGPLPVIEPAPGRFVRARSAE
jgi:polyhydroxyalkanoate synthase subunit PhaC